MPCAARASVGAYCDHGLNGGNFRTAVFRGGTQQDVQVLSPTTLMVRLQEKALVDRCVADDEEAWWLLYRTYGKLLRLLAARTLRQARMAAMTEVAVPHTPPTLLLPGRGAYYNELDLNASRARPVW